MHIFTRLDVKRLLCHVIISCIMFSIWRFSSTENEILSNCYSIIYELLYKVILPPFWKCVVLNWNMIFTIKLQIIKLDKSQKSTPLLVNRPQRNVKISVNCKYLYWFLWRSMTQYSIDMWFSFLLSMYSLNTHYNIVYTATNYKGLLNQKLFWAMLQTIFINI